MLALRLAVSLVAVLTLGDFSTAAAAPAMNPLGSVTARSANAAGPLPPAILSPWNIVPPVLDGTIGATEWANATTLDITLGGTPIIAYVMNDAGFLYLAFDAQADGTLDPGDYAGLVFDDEGGVPPILSDGAFTAAVCPSTEGFYIAGNLAAQGFPTDELFQGRAAGAAPCPVATATGPMSVAYSFATGHVVFEMRIDLAASHLQALPGQTFGVGLITVDGGTGTPIGLSSGSALDPSTYNALTLATPPALAATNVIYGTLGSAGDLLMTVDPVTGLATAIGPTGAGAMPGLAVSFSGEIYATSRGASNLYRLDAATGLATLIGPTTPFMDAIAFDRDGRLWGMGTGGASELFEIDPNTGSATFIASFSERIVGLACDPTDGTMFASATQGATYGDDGIYTLDTASGVLTPLGTTGLGNATPDIAFDVHGRLYGVKGGGGGGTPPPNTLIAIDKATGVGTVIGLTGIDGISGLAAQAFLPRVTEHVIYGTQGNAGDLLLKIDPATGAGTPIGHTGVTGMPGLAISPAGDMYAVSGGGLANDLYRIDPVTAQTFLVGNTGIEFFDSITFDETGTLYGLGVGGQKTLFKINTATAAVAAIGPTGEQLAGLAVDPATGEMYASTGGNPTSPYSIYRVNKSTGAIALIGDLGFATPNDAIPDITIDASGQMYGVIGSGGGGGGASSSDLIKIDKTTGAGAIVGPVGTVGVSGLDTWAYGAALDVPRANIPARGTFLEAARPNPFGGSTELRFALGHGGAAKIEVFNVLGQRVVTLTDGVFQAGEHFVRWNGLDAGGRPVADGIYYVRMRAGDVRVTKAVVRIR